MKKAFASTYRSRIDAAYLRGWDDAVIYKKSNPYSRRDFREAYERGWRKCDAGEALPERYRGVLARP